MTIDPISVQGPDELEGTFAAMAKERPDAIIIQGSLALKRASQLALKYRIPALSIHRQFAEEGGLMSYAMVLADVYRRAAVIVDKILRGAKPADLPVERPTKFELVINLKVARELGLTISPAFLARADEVIE